MALGIGVIGVGSMGSKHAQTIFDGAAGASLVALSDVDPERLRDMACRFGTDAISDPHELIEAADVDAVIVASHDDSHAEFVRHCLVLGKPVLCEKPLARTLGETAELVSLANQASHSAGRQLLSIGFMRRFDNGYRALRELTLARTRGRALMVHCRHRNVRAYPNSTTESAIVNSAIHEFDIVPWLLNDDIVEVSWNAGASTSAAEKGLADPMLILMRMNSGVLVTLELFINAGFGYSTECEIVFEEGTAELSETSPIFHRSDRSLSSRYPADWIERYSTAYRAEAEAWVNSLSGGASATATGSDAMKALKVAIAVQDAVSTPGKWVAVPS